MKDFDLSANKKTQLGKAVNEAEKKVSDLKIEESQAKALEKLFREKTELVMESAFLVKGPLRSEKRKEAIEMIKKAEKIKFLVNQITERKNEAIKKHQEVQIELNLERIKKEGKKRRNEQQNETVSISVPNFDLQDKNTSGIPREWISISGGKTSKPARTKIPKFSANSNFGSLLNQSPEKNDKKEPESSILEKNIEKNPDEDSDLTEDELLALLDQDEIDLDNQKLSPIKRLKKILKKIPNKEKLKEIKESIIEFKKEKYPKLKEQVLKGTLPINKFFESEYYKELGKMNKSLFTLFYLYLGGIDNFVRYQNIKENIKSLEKDGKLIVPEKNRKDPFKFLLNELNTLKKGLDNHAMVLIIHHFLPNPSSMAVATLSTFFTPAILIKILKIDVLSLSVSALAERTQVEIQIKKLRKLIEQKKHQEIKFEEEITWNQNFEESKEKSLERIAIFALLFNKKILDFGKKGHETLKDKSKSYNKTAKSVKEAHKGLVDSEMYKKSLRDLKKLKVKIKEKIKAKK